MNKNMESYRRFVYIGIIVIALGITFTTTLGDTFGSLGTVFIAVGGLFFIIGMNKKRMEEVQAKEQIEKEK